MFSKPFFSPRKFCLLIIYIYCMAAALPASAQHHYYGVRHAAKKDPAASNIAGICVLSLRYADSLAHLKQQFEHWRYNGADTLANPYYFPVFISGNLQNLPSGRAFSLNRNGSFEVDDASIMAPVNSFEFHRCRRTPQVGCLTLSLGRLRQTQTASIHRLPRGLPGYLILFDTHAFEHQRQSRYGRLPSQSEFFVISKHFTATQRIPPTYCVLKKNSSRCKAEVEPRLFTTRLSSGLRSL